MQNPNTQSVPTDTSPSPIQVHLDGHDFEGFTLRILSVVSIAVFIIWLSNLPELLVLLCVTAAWLIYFRFKIVRFKEDAYQKIIQELEGENERLQKSNRLLQNVVQDSLGMRVHTEKRPASPDS